jgi:class 3 adenylate cyclase
VVGASGFLSIFVPSFFFAASYAPFALRLKRRLPISAGGLVLLVVASLLVYGFLAGWQTELVAGLPVSKPPYAYGVVTVSVVLLGFSAWHYYRVYLRTRFPMQAALALAFVCLAMAQTLMVTSRAWSYSWWGYHLLMLVAVIAALGALFLELDRRRGLERFLPSEVVERVVAGDQLRLGGERRVATVLFADLRDSTAMAEVMRAEDAVEMLNAYVGAMGRCVFEHGGMIDKFLGDGLMAVFGVEDDPSDGALPAARAALAMRLAIAEVNRQRGADVGFRVGIHTGEVVIGSVGLPHRSDFTAIGDPVNTAARLEQLGKEYGVDNTISHDAVGRLPSNGFQLRELGAIPVRGRREPVQLYTLA